MTQQTGSTPRDSDAPSCRTTPIVSDHVLLRVIGVGSYGEVWLARTVIGAYRAVKILRRDRFNDERPYEREYQGIQNAEPISRSHAGLVHILHVGRDDRAGHFFYVMELGDDERWGQDIEPQRYSPKTLQTELHERGRLPAATCVEIGIALAEALGHLHQHGLIHRDLKPANIIFVKGAPKLADIGLVTGAMEDRSRVGTAGFMPPEGSGSRSADLYALGKIIYEMAMGKDRQQFPQLPADFREHPDRDELAGINDIVLKACSNGARQRYDSAAQMRADLETIQQGHSLMGLRRAKRRRTFLNWVAWAMLALTSALWLWTRAQTAKASLGQRWTMVPPGPTEQILIELEGYYNGTLNEPMFGSNSGNDLSSLPRGAQVFEGVTFVCAGTVQLASPLLKKDGYSVPESVRDISVFRYCRRLYFLHATGGEADDGATIAHFVVHYADGHRLEIPLVYGLDLRNWWIDPARNQETPRAVVAWTGTNPETRSRDNVKLRLFKSRWENPRPHVPVTTIDYVSNMVGWAMPFLVAATAEGWPRAEESNLGSRRIEEAKKPPGGATNDSGSVDLSAFYNASFTKPWHAPYWPGNDLNTLPRGRQTLAGVDFDIRGLIQLGCRSLPFPESARGIPVKGRCRRLHFLHAAIRGAEEGAVIGQFIMHYWDGKIEERPIVYGVDVRDWWFDPAKPKIPAGGEIAWIGTNPSASQAGSAIRLYKSSWANPRISEEVVSLDYLSSMTSAAPFLIAITAE